MMQIYLQPAGGLAQLARAFAWHAKGHRFDSGNLHKKYSPFIGTFYFKLFATLDCLLKKRNGSFQTNSRISLHQKERPEPAQGQMDRLYAWYQPHQPVCFYSLPDHPGNKIIVLKNE
jgi:hypothetical protein